MWKVLSGSEYFQIGLIIGIAGSFVYMAFLQMLKNINELRRSKHKEEIEHLNRIELLVQKQIQLYEQQRIKRDQDL